MEDVGWGDILHSPVDLHGYVNGAMLHYYYITLERHDCHHCIKYNSNSQDIHYIPLFVFGKACNL